MQCPKESGMKPAWLFLRGTQLPLPGMAGANPDVCDLQRRNPVDVGRPWSQTVFVCVCVRVIEEERPGPDLTRASWLSHFQVLAPTAPLPAAFLRQRELLTIPGFKSSKYYENELEPTLSIQNIRNSGSFHDID